MAAGQEICDVAMRFKDMFPKITQNGNIFFNHRQKTNRVVLSVPIPIR